MPDIFGDLPDEIQTLPESGGPEYLRGFDPLGQYYTRPEIAEQCWAILCRVMPRVVEGWGKKKLIFIEPSAGKGDFYKLLPEGSIGLDIAPPEGHAEGIVKQDFLAWDYRPVFEGEDQHIIIGNPPFGYRGHLAIDFFIKSAQVADTIAFVLPVNFRRYGIQMRLPQDLRLIYDEPLDKGCFYTKGGKGSSNTSKKMVCSFQIWTRLPLAPGYADIRQREMPTLTHPDFDFTYYKVPEAQKKSFAGVEFDFAVQCQGHGDFTIKKYKLADCSLRAIWALLKAHTPEALDILSGIDYNRLCFGTSVVPGFSKPDLISAYIREKEERMITQNLKDKIYYNPGPYTGKIFDDSP